MRRAEEGGSAARSGRRWRREVSALGLIVLGVGYLAWAFVRWYRPGPSDGMGGGETLLAWAALLGETFLPHCGLMLLLVLVVCAACRLWAVAAAGLPLAVLCAWPWIGLHLGGTPPAALVDEPSLLVLSANLLGDSRSDEDLIGQINQHSPDLVLLQEVREDSLGRLATALGDRYEHAAAPREGNFGVAVFSRLAFTRDPEVVEPLAGWELPQMMVWVDWGGTKLRVWDVHLLPPTGRDAVAGQARMADTMWPMLDDRLSVGEMLIVAGDFNAPWRAQPLDGLRSRGFREAHREAASGMGATWPTRGLLSLPPGIRIDHVAYSPGLACVEAWVGEPTASDHRPVFARLVLE